MIRTLDRYLARQFFGRFFVVLFALSTLGLLLDVIANAKEIVGTADGTVGQIVRYTVLRSADVTAKLYTFSVIVAALLTMTSLVRHSELTALRASGVSQWRVMAGLLPAAVLVALFQFLLDDRLVPATVDALRAWGVGEYAADAAGRGRDTWLKSDRDVVRIRHVGAQDGTLSDVAIFRRDGAGHLVELIEASSAAMSDRGWVLRNVTKTVVGVETPVRLASYEWPDGPTVDTFAMMAVHPREMTFARVHQFAARSGFGNRPNYVYLLWRSKKILTPFATIVMIMLAVPLMQRFDRSSGGGVLLAGAIAIAFLYLTLDGLLVAMGEAGLLPPLLAASAATIVLAAIAGAIGLHREGGGRPAKRYENRPD